ncbi:MAG: hypothetical protein AB7O97_12020 [Planctomycetota bacterium]
MHELAQDLLRLLASWKGVAVEPGAELQFEFSSFPGGGLGLLVLLGLVLLLAFAGFVYRRDGKTLRPWQRLLLGALRAIALLAAALVLLEPNLVSVKRETRPGTTILLVDTSQSMKQRDAFRREAVQPLATGWRELGVDAPAGATRAELLRALLAHDDGALVRSLGSRNEVQLYGYAAGLEPLPLLAEPAAAPVDAPNGAAQDATAPPPRLDLAQLQSDGRHTDLGGALRAAFEKSRNAQIAAVVILGDGRRTAGPQGAEIARMLNQRKVPHTFVLGIGDPSETQTVGIGRFEAPEKVFQKDPFEMRATVEQQGYDPMQVTVQLIRTDESGADSVVRSQQVAVGGGVTETEVSWSDLTSGEAGRFVYRVEVTPPDGEPSLPERHRKSQVVEVLGERTRVLLLAGGSNHEFQILRFLLVRDKTIDVTCWLQSADENFPQDGDEDVRIDALPQELTDFEPYDVAILIDPNPSKLTPAFCDNLRRHVIENGCGLWWVAGEKYSLEAFRAAAVTKPLIELLPVLPDVSYAESVANIGLGLAHTRAFPYELTLEGEDGVAGKVARIAETREQSRELWSRLPGFHLAFPVRDVKPAATIIAEHPSAEPRLRRQGRGMPLVVTQFVGAGRVLWSGMDETYRWRSIFEDAYNRFWVKGIRFLFEGRIHAGNSRLKLLISDDKIELGDSLTVVVEARDELLHPLVAQSVELEFECAGAATETVRLPPVEEVPGSFQTQLRPERTGTCRLRAAGFGGKPVEVEFQVVPAQIEREGPVDRAELAAVAAAAGGTLLDTPQQLLAVVQDVPSRSATDTFRTPHAIWDGWATVVVLLSALALEWLLRKRFNLL